MAIEVSGTVEESVCSVQHGIHARPKVGHPIPHGAQDAEARRYATDCYAMTLGCYRLH